MSILFKLSFFLTFLGLLLSIKGVGQKSTNQLPKTATLRSSVRSSFKANEFNLPVLNNEDEIVEARKIKEEQCSTCRKDYYGRFLDVNLDLKSQGLSYELEDGTIWLLRISSLSALGLQFYFKKFVIPPGSYLHIYNDNQTQLLGAFTIDNLNPDERFATSIIHGREAVVEYFEPKRVQFSGRVFLEGVGHVFEDMRAGGSTIQDPGSCVVDVNCQEGNALNAEKKSIAWISTLDSNNKRLAKCTGFLINSNQSSNPPSFLMTAGHC
ncbi:MAG: hypothetical protein RJQ09_11925, partial [Cyclobacteriaceae bacterium]